MNLKKLTKSQEGELLTLKTSNEYQIVNLLDISCIISNLNNSEIHFIDNRMPLMAYKQLKKFEEELSDFGFIRISRSVLLNNLHILSFKDCKNRQIAVRGGKNLTISRRLYPEIVKLLKD